MTFDSAGLPGHGVVVHFDEREEEDDRVRDNSLEGAHLTKPRDTSTASSAFLNAPNDLIVASAECLVSHRRRGEVERLKPRHIRLVRWGDHPLT
jgi:hypothetical protein